MARQMAKQLNHSIISLKYFFNEIACIHHELSNNSWATKFLCKLKALGRTWSQKVLFAEQKDSLRSSS